MDKSCNNCYYSTDESIRYELKSIMNKWCILQVDKPSDNVCSKHEYGCEHCKSGDSYNDLVEFRYKNELYCTDCLADVLGIEKREYTAYQYYDIHGNFLGDSETNDLQNILLDCSFVERVGGE